MDAATGKELKRIELERPNSIYTLEFSPDGATIAFTLRDDTTVRLLSVGTGREKLGYPRHHGPVNSIAFAPDEKSISSAGDDGIRLWDVASGKDPDES